MAHQGNIYGMGQCIFPHPVTQLSHWATFKDGIGCDAVRTVTSIQSKRDTDHAGANCRSIQPRQRMALLQRHAYPQRRFVLHPSSFIWRIYVDPITAIGTVGLVGKLSVTTPDNAEGAWIGQQEPSAGKGMAITTRAASNDILLQGQTTGGAYDQTIRLNFLGGNVALGGSVAVDAAGNITGINNLTVGGTLSIAGGITGPVTVNGVLNVTGNQTISGTATVGTLDATTAAITGTITAAEVQATDAQFATCEVANSPVRTFANTADAPSGMQWPPIGIGVSTGTAWGVSIDPTTLQTKLTLTTTGNSGPATLAGATINIPQYSGFPATGIGVSTGTAWGVSIDPTTLQTKLTLTTTGNSGPATLAGATINIPQYSGFPATGIGVSTGTAWGASINPATLATWPAVGIPVSTGTAWGASMNPATLATWPAAGVPVSTGTAWGTSIAQANIALLNAANTFTANQNVCCRQERPIHR